MRFFRLVSAFLSTRSFHAAWSAPVSTSSLAAARRICVCPIFPQPPGIGRKISGASSTNAACCSSVSIRFPYPPACEASEANFLPPTRKAGNPACEYSSTPSRLSAILRKSAAVIGRLPYVREYLTISGWHVSTAPGQLLFPRRPSHRIRTKARIGGYDPRHAWNRQPNHRQVRPGGRHTGRSWAAVPVCPSLPYRGTRGQRNDAALRRGWALSPGHHPYFL